MSVDKKRVAVLISGRGSNLDALINACSAPDFPAQISVVISNNPNAAGLEKAASAGIKSLVINHRDFGTRAEKYADGRARFDAEIDRALNAFEVDYVCLAGFMRLFSPEFTGKWEGRMLNIHPSLLPAFKGLNVHKRMIDAGVKLAGCTVHYVTADMDAGPIIGQACVPVLEDDTEETLAARILAQEHKLYPVCLRAVTAGDAPAPAPEAALLNPHAD